MESVFHLKKRWGPLKSHLKKKAGAYMHIYTSSSDVIFFDLPYNAKRLLDDSVDRTGRGWSSLREGRIFSGVSGILLARIESALAFCFATLSSAAMALGLGLAFPLAVVPIALLHGGSRIPGISSFSFAQSFREASGAILFRSFKVYALAIPIVLLFLGAASLNTFLPGLLQPKGSAFQAIHAAAAPLGPLQRIRAVVLGAGAMVGAPNAKISPLAEAEDYLRAFSSFNSLTEVQVSTLQEHRTSVQWG